MPYPRWLAKISKRFVDLSEVRKGKQPVVIHVGRSSGNRYETPLDAHPTIDGLVVRYSPRSDWVRNVLSAGSAVLRVDGREHPLDSPRLVSRQEAVERLVPESDPGRACFRAQDYLLMRHLA